MKGNKILATLIALAMVLATMVVLDVEHKIVKHAGATMGVDEWQNATTGDKILNMTTEDLVYGETVDLKFNGSIIEKNCRVYKPSYSTVYDSGEGQYEYWVNWTRIDGGLGSDEDEPTINDVNLTVAGLWLVIVDKGAPDLYRVNLSTMQIRPNATAPWEDIVGWFWVNSSSWSVHLSKTSIFYDKNESLIVTVKKDGDPITSTGWVDIWNVSGDKHTLVYHRELDEADEGVWEISGSLMYEFIHSKGAGTYRVTAYEDISPSHTIAKDIYGDEGGSSYDGKYGFNSTFGNTSIWTKFDGAIRDWHGDPAIDNNDTTYRWDTCGPFDPPEYWADYENLTVKAGVPTFKITNDTQFWNDTADNEVLINVTDYDGNPLLVFNEDTDVSLYNKSNRPSRSGSNPINSSYYNVTIDGDGEIHITPRGPWNHWGVNTSIAPDYIWAEKGTVYIVIHNGTGVGNETEEWNGTAEITLTSATATFKWIDDGSPPLADGELLEIPIIGSVPYDFKFKITGPDYEKFGEDGKEVEAAENITISGDSLFTGKLDKFPGFDTNWYSNGVWTVPMIPTMRLNGGEIKITAKAWNKTITGTLSIGGNKYWTNGSVITVIPNEFKIDEADRTLSITVKDATGYDIRGADVYLHYIDDGGDPIEAHAVDHITSDASGLYSMIFNITQQTENQTGTLPDGAGFTDIKAPRNLTIYVDSAAGYGYAKIKMIPVNDLEVELSQTVFLAGYSYDYFYINTTLVGNTTDTPHEDDKAEFFIKIYNESGSDVTDSLLSGGTYTGADLTNDADYSFELTDVYITEPGTYTVYAYNNTHDSTGYNATFVVKQVTVSCDKTAFIWRYDDNISATFTVTYLGAPINGSLIIDNMTSADDYNKTWFNTSFDGTNDQGDYASIEIDEDELINGQVTIYDITANNLTKAVQNITFWFIPAFPHDGAYAQALGVVPVKIADITPTPRSLPYSKPAKLEILLTGRGTPLPDLLVNISIPGISGEMSTRTDATGVALFAFTPPTTGNVIIKIENRTSSVKVPVTSWALYLDAPSQANEGAEFTLTVRNGTATGAGVAGVAVLFAGETKTTDSSGQATFTAPAVTAHREYTILATKEGYAEDTATILILNKPKLIIVAQAEAITSQTFNVVIADDAGSSVVGATVTLNEVTYTTGAQGIATLTAPSEEGDYTISATFTGYTDADPVTIKIVPGGIPGFELLTLIAAIGVAFILLRRRRN